MENVTASSAAAVKQAIDNAGRTIRSVSDQTGIPYSTLNRKLDAKSEFRFSELLLIAEDLGVSPSDFIPAAFHPASAAAA